MDKIDILLQRAKKLTRRSKPIISIVMPDGGGRYRLLRDFWDGTTNHRKESTHATEQAALDATDAPSVIVIDV